MPLGCFRLSPYIIGGYAEKVTMAIYSPDTDNTREACMTICTMIQGYLSNGSDLTKMSLLLLLSICFLVTEGNLPNFRIVNAQ